MRPAVRLWRIEHPADGIGPFQSEDIQGNTRPCIKDNRWCPNGAGLSGQHPYNMPVPEYETCVRLGDLPSWRRHIAYTNPIHARYKFAYLSLDSLLRWFPGWALHQIAEQGYIVKVVGVPWEAHTRWRVQARYDSERATVLRVLSPADLYWQSTWSMSHAA